MKRTAVITLARGDTDIRSSTGSSVCERPIVHHIADDEMHMPQQTCMSLGYLMRSISPLCRESLKTAMEAARQHSARRIQSRSGAASWLSGLSFCHCLVHTCHLHAPLMAGGPSSTNVAHSGESHQISEWFRLFWHQTACLLHSKTDIFQRDCIASAKQTGFHKHQAAGQ